jgi:predicted metal-binding protein
MGSSKERCKCCNLRGDKGHKLSKVESLSLISKLNKMSPNEPISEGMLVCEKCRKKANNTIESDPDDGNNYIFISID